MSKTGAWEHSTIKDLKKYKDFEYSIDMDNGWSFFLSSNGKYEPQVGNRISQRTYKNRVAEVVVNGVVLYCKTDEEMEQQFTDWQKHYEQEKLDFFNANKSKWNAEVKRWPKVFRDRIQMFRTVGGQKWRIQWEGYELSACREAIYMAKAFKTEYRIKKFMKNEKQLTAKRTVYKDHDGGHSGNTWGMAKRLAYWFIVKPENVYNEHGVGTPLAGCKDYPCPHPRPDLFT